jgi:hypothetical protein
LSYGENVTLEINKPELEALIQKLRQNGANLDELLFNGLNAIADQKPFRAPRRTRAEAAAHMREARRGNRLPEGVTIRDLMNEGRA